MKRFSLIFLGALAILMAGCSKNNPQQPDPDAWVHDLSLPVPIQFGSSLVETKGGFDKTGASEDIDIFSPKKFEELKRYLNKYNLKGGFVRFDKQSEELCICMDNYNEDIHSNDWKILSEVFK